MNKLSLEELEDINNHIIYYCRAKSLLIDTVVWCPHHPHKGYDSENKILKTDCFCRKPKPGMLLQLAYERNIDLKSSLFVVCFGPLTGRKFKTLPSTTTNAKNGTT